MIWVSSYLKLPSCPAAFIAATTDTQLCLELKIHKCFLKKLLIWRSLAAKNIFLLFLKKACNKAINIYSPPQALACLLLQHKLSTLPWPPEMGLSSGLYFLIPGMSLTPVWWPPALTGTCDQQQTDWDGCKLPLELVEWSCLPGRGHFWQLSADGFRGTCLGNEDIWDNFPCDCRLCP